MAYEPRDLGTHAVSVGAGVDDSESLRCYLGVPTIEYLDLARGESLFVYEGAPGESVIVATQRYAPVLDDADITQISAYTVSPGDGGRPRSRIAQTAATYLGLTPEDSITVYYGEPGQYVLVEVGENPLPSA